MNLTLWFLEACVALLLRLRRPLARRRDRLAGGRCCAVCGCTDSAPCLSDGAACSWIIIDQHAPDSVAVCSACWGIEEAA